MNARARRVLVVSGIAALVLGAVGAFIVIPKIARSRATRLGDIGDGLTRTHALVSPDGKRVAQLVHRGKAELVGNPQKPSLLITSPGGKDFVVLDDKPGKEYYSINHVTLLFSPDSRRFAYRGENGWALDEGSTQVYVIDGIEGKPYDQVKGFIFSPDSKRTAYVATKAKKERVVLDGAELREYDGISTAKFSFSADGKRLAYEAYFDGKWSRVEERGEGNR